MFRGFIIQSLNISGIDYELAKATQETRGAEILDKLKEYIVYQDRIDASEMQENWFPLVDANVFISHSHKDIRTATLLAGYLEEKLGLSPFIDSYLWGYSMNLLNLLKERFPPKNESELLWMSSNVNMMLSTALSMMIDKCECLFFYNTPNSLSMDTYLSKTMSPWIYHELSISKLIKKRPRLEHREQQINFAMIKEAAEFEYTVDLGHMKRLSADTIKKWVNEAKSKSKFGQDTLDILYRLLPSKKLLFS